MGHNSFTSDDERHLAGYLITHNPDAKGRKGTTIYKELTSDTGQWPWSKRHSWQSWRNHYVKNDAHMEKKIRVYRKKMVIELNDDKEDAKQLSTKKKKEVSGSCSGEQANNRKRGRESLGSQVDANKRQKVPDKQVRRSSALSSDKANVEPETDMTRKDNAGRKVLGPGVSPANEPESKSSGKPDEQSVEGLLLMDRHDDDTEERQEVHKMLENVAGSGSNISEDQSTVRQDVSHRPSSVTGTEATTANPLAPHSDGSFNSLFDDAPSEPASDSEKEITNTIRKVAKSYQLTQRDGFFRSSPETDAALANGCNRPPANKVKMSPRRQPPILVEGPFVSTFVKRSSRIRESDGNEFTDTHSHSIEKTKLPAEARRGSGGDVDVDAWLPTRKRLRAPSLTRETQEEHSEQGVEVVPTQKVEKKPDNKTRRRRESLHRNDEKHAGRSVERSERHHGDRQLGRVPGTDSLPETPGHAVTTKSKIPPIDSVSISGDPHHLKLRPICDEDKRIDLRVERRKKVILRQSAGSSRSGSVAANHSTSHGTRQSPSLSLHLSTQDQSFVASLGIQQAITMMSDNHGFTETVVSRILQTVNSIAKADEILRLMRVKAEEEATRQLAANMTDSSENISASRPKPASKEHQLRISELPDDEDHLSDYSPPLKTRAGSFTRLVEQGRNAEAYTREARRASGTISPMKLASNTPDKSNSIANSPSRNSLPLGTPPNAEENFFLDNQKEESEKVTEDVHELFDAHAAVADDLKKKEEGLGPLRSFHRFQQAAMFLKVLTGQQS